MAFDKKYYQDRKNKLAQKLAKIKDQYITDIINTTNRVVGEIQEIQIDTKEIDKIIQENEPKQTKKK